MDRTPRQPTPEELRWRQKAYDPEKARKNLRRQYGLSALWSAVTIGWIVLVIMKIVSFGWAPVVVLAAGYTNLALGIIRNKRTAAGKNRS